LTPENHGFEKPPFISMAAIYAVWMGIGIVEVIRGRESKLLLLGLPGGLLSIWLFLRATGKSGSFL
jgi:hypothetical protein